MVTNKPNDTNSEKILYKELSYRVMEAAFAVHNELGPGFTEVIYQEALIYELAQRDIPVERQKFISIRYHGRTIGTYKIDLIADGKIVLELKAVSDLADIHKQQTLAYLKATNLHLGILINFGKSKVQYLRIAN